MKKQNNGIENHYQRNKESYLIRAKKWYDNNKPKHQEYDKQYRIDNMEKRREYDKTRNKYRNEYNKIRRQSDLNYKIKHNFRSRFSMLLKQNKTYKTNSVINLLGCSLDELKQHLEFQFRDGMNFENHGTIWEIDHIKPCSKFDLTNIEEQKICFHYTNLQPLYKQENRKKSNKIL